MKTITQINLIHHYQKADGSDPITGDDIWVQQDIKMSYAVVGDYGLYEYGEISKDYYFDYSAPFSTDTKLTNASNVEVVKGIIRDYLNEWAGSRNYEDSWVEFVEDIEHATRVKPSTLKEDFKAIFRKAK